MIVELTDEEVAVLGAALGELPLKVSMPLWQKLNTLFQESKKVQPDQPAQ